MLEVACWPAAGGERQRYAGTSHIDVTRVDVGSVRDLLDCNGLEISSLAYYPNNLHPDAAERGAANTHLKKVIDAAAKLEVGLVGTFVGRDQTKNVPAKDLEIDRDGLYRNGTVSVGIGWQVPRLPGLGEVRWNRFLAALYRAGYDFVVSIEHEDRAFEATEELVKRGFLIARDTLEPLIH
jgi:sugar phosphate isomerase/epimerase